jgi:very-short-patch-repair endonuclease
MRSSADHIIFEVLAGGRGACTRSQLLAAGVSASAIDRRLRSGLLVAVHGGVYVWAARRREVATLAAAALLAAPGAALGNFTAADRHCFPLPEEGKVHLVITRGPARSFDPHVVVHRTRWLPAADLTVVDGWPVTSPARTLCDLAADLRPARLRHLVERQLLDGRPAATELVACHRQLARRGRPGTAAMRQVLGDLLDDEPFPESDLELALARLLADAGLAGFRRQYRPPWYDGVRGVVDFAQPAARLVVEADGRRWHGTDQARVEDRRRDRAAALAGWRVLRYGWEEVLHRPRAVADEISEAVRCASRLRRSAG